MNSELRYSFDEVIRKLNLAWLYWAVPIAILITIRSFQKYAEDPLFVWIITLLLILPVFITINAPVLIPRLKERNSFPSKKALRLPIWALRSYLIGVFLVIFLLQPLAFEYYELGFIKFFYRIIPFFLICQGILIIYTFLFSVGQVGLQFQSIKN